MSGPVSYYPIVRQLVAAKKMDVVDSARFMALASVAAADAFIAVFDAKCPSGRKLSPVNLL